MWISLKLDILKIFWKRVAHHYVVDVFIIDFLTLEMPMFRVLSMPLTLLNYKEA